MEKEQNFSKIEETFKNLGYDLNSGLQNDISRVFVLTMHSEEEIEYEMVDGIQEYEWQAMASEMMIEENGRQIYKNGPLKVICAYHE